MEQTLANIKSGRFDSPAQVPTAMMIERWKESKKLSACELLRSCSAPNLLARWSRANYSSADNPSAPTHKRQAVPSVLCQFFWCVLTHFRRQLLWPDLLASGKQKNTWCHAPILLPLQTINIYSSHSHWLLT